jgi:hypothetical protein
VCFRTHCERCTRRMNPILQRVDRTTSPSRMPTATEIWGAYYATLLPQAQVLYHSTPVVQAFGRGWPSAALLSTFIAPLFVSLFEQPQIAMLPSEVQHLPATGRQPSFCFCRRNVPGGYCILGSSRTKRFGYGKNAIAASTPWIVAPRYPTQERMAHAAMRGHTERLVDHASCLRTCLQQHTLFNACISLLSATRAGHCWGLLCTLYHGHAIMQSLIAPCRQTTKSEMQKCSRIL